MFFCRSRALLRSARLSRRRRTPAQHAVLRQLVERHLRKDLVLGRRRRRRRRWRRRWRRRRRRRRRSARRRGGGGGGAGVATGASFRTRRWQARQTISAAATNSKLESSPSSPQSKMALPSYGKHRQFSHTHMDRLLEATARAERDHFWFHGFRRFVAAAARRRRPRGRRGRCDPRLRLRHRQQPRDAAPVRSRLRHRHHLERPGLRPRAAASAGSRTRRRRACPSPRRSSTSSPRSTCSTRSTTRWSGMRSMRCIGCCGPEDTSSSTSRR